MKYLIVVRHGDGGTKEDYLNDRGIAQMDMLADKLKLFVDGGSVLILTSPTRRTRKSADILGTAFSAEIEEHEVLWSEASHLEDFPMALELVRSKRERANTLVLVTHHEYASFPAYYAEKELEILIWGGVIEKGEAWVLDCSQKTLNRVT